jgi:uncharacterized protein (TIGR03032 family)
VSVSAISAAPPEPGLATAGATTVPTAVEFRYRQTESFPALLQRFDATLLVTTYQANKLLVVRAAGGGLSTLVRTFDRPMGLAVDARRLALGTRQQVWLFRNAPDIAARVEPAGQHDACYLPRSSHVTGDIGVHDVAWAGDELWIVNTRFSCLCTLAPDYSFVPRWRPPFVSGLTADDRCHLNGLAVSDGRPRVATALGETDAPGGWRANKAGGGCLIDVAAGEIVARGLCMPHSPRWHDGRLWLLESGTGRLVLVDPQARTRQTIAELPGYARGLALCGPLAFVGLSKIRERSSLRDVPLVERGGALICGVAVLELHSGRIVASLEFQTAVEEIYDVQLIQGLRFPEVIGFEKEAVHHTFVVPPGAV